MRRGHGVSVCTYIDGTHPGYDYDGVRVHPAQALEQLARRADVLVSHAGDRGQAQAASVRYDVPLVRMVHGAPIPDKGLEGADLVVFNSKNLALTAGNPRRGCDSRGHRAIICPPPVLPEAHYAGSRGERITQVNLAPEKGGETFKLLAASEPHRPFLGVLGGYGRQMHPTAPNTRLEQPVADMRTIWRRTRVLLVPSVRETWGMAAVEAAINGIPVIAHPTEGVQEALGESVLYADRGNLSAWRQHLADLDDPAYYDEVSFRISEAAAMHDPRGSLARFADAVEHLTQEAS